MPYSLAKRVDQPLANNIRCGHHRHRLCQRSAGYLFYHPFHNMREFNSVFALWLAYHLARATIFVLIVGLVFCEIGTLIFPLAGDFAIWI